MMDDAYVSGMGLFIIDMNEYKLPEECEKIVERLYVFVDTKDIRQNIRLNLVVNPEIIKILINQVASEPSPVKVPPAIPSCSC
jgi:hypothetical protein